MNLERSPTPMEEAMFRWLKSERNITAQMIGARLVLGERLNPKRSREVLKTLDLWYAKCVQTWPVQYEVLLAATALISLEMQCDRKTKKVVANRAFEYLHKILSKERHPFVRRTIIEAIRAQTDQRLQEIEPQLRALFNEFTDEERNQVVDTLTRVYQRSIQSTHS
jgi:hypothetical protein